MKFIIMYLLCGILWSAYILSIALEDKGFKESLNDITEKVGKNLFKKDGLIVRYETVRKYVVGCTFGIIALVWPWAITKIVIGAIKKYIKKH